MAIKITRAGTPPREQLYKGSCNTCNTEIECVISDTSHIVLSDPDNTVLRYVECPVCHATHLYVEPVLDSVSAVA